MSKLSGIFRKLSIRIAYSEYYSGTILLHVLSYQELNN